jgi:hypothetical protein
MKPVRVKMLEDTYPGSTGSAIIFSDQVQYDENGNQLSVVTDEEGKSGYLIVINCDRAVSKYDYVMAYFDTTNNEYVLMSNGSNFHIGLLQEDIRPGGTSTVYIPDTHREVDVVAPFFEHGWGKIDEIGRVIKSGTSVGISKNSDNSYWDITLVCEVEENSSSSLMESSNLSSGSDGSASSQSEGELIDVVIEVSFDTELCQLITTKRTVRVLEIVY